MRLSIAGADKSACRSSTLTSITFVKWGNPGFHAESTWMRATVAAFRTGDAMRVKVRIVPCHFLGCWIGKSYTEIVKVIKRRRRQKILGRSPLPQMLLAEAGDYRRRGRNWKRRWLRLQVEKGVE